MTEFNALYIGNFRDLDTIELFSLNPELAASTFANTTQGSASDPLYNHVTTITPNDTNRDGEIKFNNSFGRQETISYTLDGQTYSREIDTGFSVTGVTITRQLPDGTTDTATTTVRIIQDTAGNVFMIPPPTAESVPGEIEAITTYPITSITFPSSSNFVYGFGEMDVDRYDAQSFVPCFTAGTMIDTPDGPRAVETLMVGDLVLTRDHGAQPIRWTGRRTLSAAELAGNERLRPVRIAAGALGVNMPAQDLVVSPQHRILVRSTIAQRMFDSNEVLIAAKHLVAVPGIDHEPAGDVTYVHIMFDQHQIVTSNGAETESLFAGKMALEALGPDAAAEIFALFPELRDKADAYAPARALIEGRRGREAARRHAQNGQRLAS